jgi:hypothetical protein
VFGQLRVRRAGSTAIDTAALLRAVADPDVRGVLADAVCGVLAALMALADPGLVVLGGTWGADPAVVEAVTGGVARLSRQVPVRPARVTGEPSLTGARRQALHDLRAAVLAGSQ